MIKKRQAQTLSCVIPGLNEAENLPALMPVLVAKLCELVPDFEIIFVDDGSTDATPLVIEQLRQTYPQLVYLQLSRNFGKEAALTAGLEASCGQVVVCMDADLQHPPALIEAMLERWSTGLEMVYAVRETRDDETWMKRVGTSLFYKLMRTSNGLRVPRDAGDFRLMDRCVVDALMALPERSRFMKGLFAWSGFRQAAVEYERAPREVGTTKFRYWKLWTLALDGIEDRPTTHVHVLHRLYRRLQHARGEIRVRRRCEPGGGRRQPRLLRRQPHRRSAGRACSYIFGAYRTGRSRCDRGRRRGTPLCGARQSAHPNKTRRSSSRERARRCVRSAALARARPCRPSGCPARTASLAGRRLGADTARPRW